MRPKHPLRRWALLGGATALLFSFAVCIGEEGLFVARGFDEFFYNDDDDDDGGFFHFGDDDDDDYDWGDDDDDDGGWYGEINGYIDDFF